LEGRLAEIRWRIGKRVHGNRSAGKAGMWAITGEEWAVAEESVVLEG
jgi:hypothetical protein